MLVFDCATALIASGVMSRTCGHHRMRIPTSGPSTGALLLRKSIMSSSEQGNFISPVVPQSQCPLGAAIVIRDAERQDSDGANLGSLEDQAKRARFEDETTKTVSDKLYIITQRTSHTYSETRETTRVAKISIHITLCYPQMNDRGIAARTLPTL